MPDVLGTLITVAPVAGPIGHLLRTAIDAEQVGATRLHLPADQPDLATTVAALRGQTRLILTCDAGTADVDVVRADFIDAVVGESSDLPGVVAQVARLVAENPAGITICGSGSSALPTLLAALAAGGHIWVGAPEHESAGPGPAPHPRDHAALVARASGLARIAGRPPLDRRAARTLLGLA